MTGPQPEKTDDGRWIIVSGRRWRATDPAIPEGLKDELVRELMRARRAIKSGDLTARARVHAAKVALGERGEPWWEPTDEGRRARALAATSTLLRERRGEPVHADEVARVVGGDGWQDILAIVESVFRDQHSNEKWVLQEDDAGLSVTAGPGFET